MDTEETITITIAVNKPLAELCREIGKGEKRSLKAQAEKMIEDQLKILRDERETQAAT